MAKLLRSRHLHELHASNLLKLLGICRRFIGDKVVALEIDKYDVLDEFTSELINQRIRKWDRIQLRKVKRMLPLAEPVVATPIALSRMSQEQLDATFMQMMHDETESEIVRFLKQCQDLRMCPTVEHALFLLDSNSSNANLNIILETQQLYKDNAYSLFYKNGGFNHYLAEAYWSNGEVIKALNLFEEVYAAHSILRRRIRLMLRCLILDLTTLGEAVLVSVIKFGERMYVQYRDPFPLSCVWQACFLSEWFCDQKLALELLDKYEWLTNAIVGNLIFIVGTSLTQHRVDVVYRLLEILLKFEMKPQYSSVLISLFTYKFHMGDLKGCLEIIQWSVTYNVDLPQLVHEQFLMLLLNRKNIDDVRPTKQSRPTLDMKF